jgi:hypothetical protein
MNEIDGLLNARELMAKLKIGVWYYYAHRPQLERLFQVARPLGQKKYSARLVEQYLAGESASRFGKGARG